MANFAFLRCGNMFYPLGELQLLVFHRRAPSDGFKIAILVDFDPNLATS